MADGRMWRARAADHWTKACRTNDPAQAYVNLMIAADCYARAVKADNGADSDAEPADSAEKPDSPGSAASEKRTGT